MIHISQFYSCSEIKLACEMYYVCELGKYLKLKYDECLSLEGVILHSDLQRSVLWDYFRYAIDEGWVINHGLPDSTVGITIQFPLSYDTYNIDNVFITLDKVEFDREDYDRRMSDAVYKFRMPRKIQMSLEDSGDGVWYWEINGEGGNHYIENNNAINHNRADQTWMSFIAMVAVERLMTDKVKRLLILFDAQSVMPQLAVSYVIILSECTDCLSGWCFFTYAENISDAQKNQLGYSAWYAKGKDLGMLNRWFSAKEKLGHLQKLDLVEGDMVMLYERERQQKHNYIKTIAGCRLARINDIQSDGISFELINTTKTKFQLFEEFEDKTMAVKQMYSYKNPYDEMRTTSQTIGFMDLGVEYMMHDERYFITPLSESDDVKVVRVSDGKRKDTLLLDQNNLAYWIMSDYGFEYNHDRYVERYFRGSEPLRDRYMRGETLEEDWYFKEDDK